MTSPRLPAAPLRPGHRMPARPGPGIALLALPAAFLLTGCDAAAPAALAVGPVAYEADEVRGLGPEQLRTLASLTALGLMAAEGSWEEGGAPRLERARRGLLAERLREELILEGAGVTEAELEVFYARSPEVELEVRHLVVLAEPWEPEAARREARSRAEAGLARIQAGEAFEAVVAEVSEEPGAAARGGLLRPGRRGTWVDEFWIAALTLDEGEVSPVVESPYGFHVLRLEARRPLPFADARPQVVRQVARGLGGGEAWEEAREGWVSALEGWVSALEVVPPSEAPRPQIPSFPAPVPVPAPSEPALLLVRWPGGGLTAEAFRRHLLALPARTLAGLAGAEAPGAEALEAELLAAAQAFLLAERAGERGIAPGDADRAALAREWESEAGMWAGLLGFSQGLAPDAVKERALAGLRATGQNARIGREGAASASPTLLHAHTLTGSALEAGGEEP
jgi:hypothetical protein